MTRPDGIALMKNFIPVDMHDSLVRFIDSQPWDTTLQRRTQHYGYRYDYSRKSQLEKADTIPAPLMLFCIALSATGHFPKVPDQVIVNEYTPGQGINPHIDRIDQFGPSVASLSLGSDCLMQFTKAEESYDLLLPKRSMLMLMGEARYRWRHSIAARKTDELEEGTIIQRQRRISATFRTALT